MKDTKNLIDELKKTGEISDKRKTEILKDIEVDDNVIDDTDFLEEELNALRDEIGWDVDDEVVWEEYLSRKNIDL